MNSVFLVDDHALIRRGMRDALLDEGFQCAGEAGSWDELAPLVGRVAFDVLVLDINLPGRSGLDVLETLKARGELPPTLVVSMYPEDPYAVRALRAGAHGYVSKASDPASLTEALRTVARGGRFVPPAAAAALAETAGGADLLPHQRLSAREQVLLGLLAVGRKLPEIALELGVPDRTVGVYRARLLEKMKLSTNADLAEYARRHHLLPPLRH